MTLRDMARIIFATLLFAALILVDIPVIHPNAAPMVPGSGGPMSPAGSGGGGGGGGGGGSACASVCLVLRML